ncbi:MAG: hypothetical protein ACKO3W_12470, partial [bacterium]
MHRLHSLRRAGTACLLGLTLAVGLLALASEWALAVGPSVTSEAQATDIPAADAPTATTPAVESSPAQTPTAAAAPESRAITIATGV